MSIFKEVIDYALSQPQLSLSYVDLVAKFGFDQEQIRAAVGRHNRRARSDADRIFIRDARYRDQLVRPSQLTKKNRPVKKRDTRNVLVIGDLHEPFCKQSYLDFCKETYEKYNCTHTIFIGDIIDNHYSSYHETDPDGMSAIDELQAAIRHVEDWVDAFPDADVVIGNHDRLIARKAFSGGISALWLREYNEVLNAPGWNFQEEFVYDDVRYIHGEGGTARNKVKKDLISTVQGHLHAQAYVEHIVGAKFRVFGMQVGCGINHKSYAMAYGKAFAKPAISVGLVLDHGQDAFVRMMKL